MSEGKGKKGKGKKGKGKAGWVYYSKHDSPLAFFGPPAAAAAAEAAAAKAADAARVAAADAAAAAAARAACRVAPIVIYAHGAHVNWAFVASVVAQSVDTAAQQRSDDVDAAWLKLRAAVDAGHEVDTDTVDKVATVDAGHDVDTESTQSVNTAAQPSSEPVVGRYRWRRWRGGVDGGEFVGEWHQCDPEWYAEWLASMKAKR